MLMIIRLLIHPHPHHIVLVVIDIVLVVILWSWTWFGADDSDDGGLVVMIMMKSMMFFLVSMTSAAVRPGRRRSREMGSTEQPLSQETLGPLPRPVHIYLPSNTHRAYRPEIKCEKSLSTPRSDARSTARNTRNGRLFSTVCESSVCLDRKRVFLSWKRGCATRKRQV
eukprot:1574205-Rhodomonas_salina.1